MRKLTYILLFVLIWGSIDAQIHKYGIPFIKNYSSSDYSAVEQNWCVVKDNRGIMYFGNNDAGVLEFDGSKWRKIPISNRSIVRSLAVDDNGTVFVGAVGEFGYLAPDENGNMNYISLSEKLDTSSGQFQNVWRTYCHDGKVYFCPPSPIFVFDYKTVTKFSDSDRASFMTFLVNGHFYVGNYQKGLMELTKDSLFVINGGEQFQFMNILSILPDSLGENLIVATANDGIFLYNMKDFSVTSNVINPETENICMSSTLYHGFRISPDLYSYCMLYEGTGNLLLDYKGNIINQFNKTFGINDDQPVSSFEASENEPLWLALNNGISKININSPIAKFSEISGIKGSVNDIIRHNDILYVATSMGIFYLVYNNNVPAFKQIPDLNTTWSLSDFEISDGTVKLLAGTADGLYEIKQGYAIPIELKIDNIDRKRKYNIYYLKPSRFLKNTIYIGTNKGLAALEFINEGLWHSRFEIDQIKDEVRSIEEENENILWLGTGFQGVAKVMGYKTSAPDFKFYGEENGLPSLSSNFIVNYNNKIHFITDNGFYNFLPDEEKFVQTNEFNERYSKGIGVFRFKSEKNGNVWVSLTKEDKKTMTINKWIERIEFIDGKPVVDSIPFKILPKISFDVIYHDKNGITWLGCSEGIFSYNANFKKDYSKKYFTLIRKAIIGIDSIAFNGTYYSVDKDGNRLPAVSQPENLKIAIDYKNNNITFEFACPFFDDETATEYSSMLEGYKDDSWSKWSTKTERVFTNLGEGDYVFKVKSRNLYGVESEIATFEFSVLPPWYRTIWAYIAYVILSIVVVYVIIKIYTRRLELEKIRLEGIVRERTAEVVRQKEDIEKKNVTLEQQKVEIERQRDVVITQKNHIEEIHREVTDSINYAKRIQKAILPHPEYASEILNEHFILFKPKDIVSGDFYFATKVADHVLFAAADCTGHGVPGAFMSMMGVAFLNEIVNDENVTKAGQVLDELRNNIIKALQQTGAAGTQKDGMDLSFCALDVKTNELQWAGANNPLYLIRRKTSDSKLLVKVGDQTEMLDPALNEGDYDLFELKPDKMPVAIHIQMDNFTNNIIQLQKGDTIYVFSDGFADQFGGPKGKKFMYKPFKKLLLDLQDKPMEEHKHVLDEAIEAWKAHIDPITNDLFEQVDDICIVGVRIK